jgi:4-aminobutyrate aminotransferase-like enzyme
MEPIGPEEILRKKSRYLFPCVYNFYRKPMQIVRGEGAYVFDHVGRRYLDLYAGVCTVSLGHCHPEVVSALTEQAAALQHTTTIYLTQPLVDLAERLAQVAPGDLQRSFFCASGSEANETASLLATLYTGRKGLVALRDSLHGRTKLGMSLTGLEFWRTDPFPIEQVALAANPNCYRCPLGREHPACDLACADDLERAMDSLEPEAAAAMIIEPIQGNGGVIVPPQGYLQRASEIARRRGALLILDEIQTGFCRTGRWFGCEHAGIVPDIMTVAKALGNGQPIAACLTTDEVASCYTRPGASTFGGNPVSAASGLATLAVMTRERLAERAAGLGRILMRQLVQLKSRHPIIGDVRGAGLMVGVELVGPDAEPASEQTDLVLERLKDFGYLVGKTGSGRNVLTLTPPLVVTETELSEFVHILDRVLAET